MGQKWVSRSTSLETKTWRYRREDLVIPMAPAEFLIKKYTEEIFGDYIKIWVILKKVFTVPFQCGKFEFPVNDHKNIPEITWSVSLNRIFINCPLDFSLQVASDERSVCGISYYVAARFPLEWVANISSHRALPDCFVFVADSQTMFYDVNFHHFQFYICEIRII